MATVIHAIRRPPSLIEDRKLLCSLRPIKHSAHEVSFGDSAFLFSAGRLVAAVHRSVFCCYGKAALNPKSRKHIAIWQGKALQHQLSEHDFLVFVSQALSQALTLAGSKSAMTSPFPDPASQPENQPKPADAEDEETAEEEDEDDEENLHSDDEK